MEWRAEELSGKEGADVSLALADDGVVSVTPDLEELGDAGILGIGRDVNELGGALVVVLEEGWGENEQQKEGDEVEMRKS